MESTFIKSVNFKEFKGTEDQYHKNKDYVSKSALSLIKVSPAHYKEPEEKPETDALIFGSAYHCYVLEPERFERDYYIFDEQNAISAIIAKANSEGKDVQKVRATKAYKEWLKGQEKVSAGKKMITKDLFDRIERMKERLFRHPYAKMLLTNGRPEVSYMGSIETETGTINVKFKPDYIKDTKHLVVDLKTAADASIDGFTRAAADHDYHIQAAFYADLMTKIEGQNRDFTFMFIAQEKVSPFAFNIFEASPQFMAQGRYEYEMLLQLYKFCLDNDRWPGYQVFCQNKYGILELKLPAWSIKDLTYYDHIDRKISKQKELSITNGEDN